MAEHCSRHKHTTPNGNGNINVNLQVNLNLTIYNNNGPQNRNVNFAQKRIDLGGVQLTEDALQQISFALHGNPGVRELIMGRSNVGNRGSALIANGLANNTSLEILDLSDTQIGKEGILALVEALRKNTSLTRLSLESNDIGNEEAILLADALCENTTLRSLSLKGNRIQNVGEQALRQAIMENTKLEELFLDDEVNLRGVYQNRGANAKAFILDGTSYDLSTQHVHIDNENLSVDHMLRFAHLMKNNEQVTSLRLGNNNIDDDGISEFVHILEDNNTLEVLRLDRNNIGNNGIGSLAKSLKVNKKLEYLDLSSNNIGDEGATALAGMLMTNRALKTLKLSGNLIGEAGKKALRDALVGYNDTIERLCVDDGTPLGVNLRRENSFEGSNRAFPPSNTQRGAPLASNAQHRAPPASNTQRRAPPASNTQHRAPPASNTQHRAPPASNTQRRAPPASNTGRIEFANSEKSPSELDVVSKRLNFISESILNIRCPRCHAVFVDFSQNLALNCSNSECKAQFCGWCLLDCGHDAHPHVPVCPKKPKKANKYYGEMEDFVEVHRERRTELLRNYWKNEILREPLQVQHMLMLQLLRICEADVVDLSRVFS